MKKIINLKIKLLLLNLFFTLFLGKNLLAEQIKICVPTSMVSALVYLAQEQGYFLEQGIELKLQEVTNSKICQDLLLAKNIDLAISLQGVFAYIIARKPSVKIIASIHRNYEVGILASKKSGIKEAKDLVNKTIAYLPGTRSALFLNSYLEKNKIDAKQIKFISLQPPLMPAALIGAKVDAIVIWQPWAHQAAKGLGLEVINLDDRDLALGEVLLLAQDDYIKSNKIALVKVLKALVTAQAYLDNNLTKAQEEIAKRVNFDSEMIKNYWDKYDNKVLLEPKLIELLKNDFRYVKQEVSELQDLADPKYEEFIDSSILSEFAPERVKF